MKKIFEYLYYEHGYWLFDWVLPLIGFAVFCGVIIYLAFYFFEPVTVELLIEVK